MPRLRRWGCGRLRSRCVVGMQAQSECVDDLENLAESGVDVLAKLYIEALARQCLALSDSLDAFSSCYFGG